tara:strand:- start:287 stop:991 length:705 start_codon:yes stop_codon:yes gene_type:complete
MDLNVKLFADGANKEGMLEMYANPIISGFTTNPTLMKIAGVEDYKSFALDILSLIKDKPISFEVFSDDYKDMKRQAMDIASWAENVYVKIPITNTKAEPSVNLIDTLSSTGVKVNVTAIMTVKQVESVLPALSKGPGGYVSVFAGRIADTGIDPLPLMSEVVDLLRNYSNVELIWASPRELFNIVQANSIGCHIITATNNILSKLHTLGKDLTDFSLETVRMFHSDAVSANYRL